MKNAMLTAENANEFGLELLMLEPAGETDVYQIAREALNKWRDDPEMLAEAAAELYAAMVRTMQQNNEALQKLYLNLFDNALFIAKEHLKPSFQESFGDRLVQAVEIVEKNFRE